ncbi:hypothetical protein TGPRC2_293250 [Toxoplasma gondii TgCatPRC2]|uniref:Uncharacterized protein n=1 Tax=Toxoplasma gondii TgCatPRC2 TaxID=1130821 RepID=A0A151H9H8_TOXGO|nr:hypothetical protein TGPRC2_293250 [Toxoplasma gondii TgCatPRC2]
METPYSQGPCGSMYIAGAEMCNGTGQNYSMIPSVPSSGRSSCHFFLPDTERLTGKSAKGKATRHFGRGDDTIQCREDRICNAGTRAHIVSREAKTKFPATPFSEQLQSSGSPARRGRETPGRARRRVEMTHEPRPRGLRRRRKRETSEEDSSELSSVSASGSTPRDGDLVGRYGRGRESGHGVRRGSRERSPGESLEHLPTKNIQSGSSSEGCAGLELQTYTERPSPPGLHLSVCRLLSTPRPATSQNACCVKEPKRTTLQAPREQKGLQSLTRSGSLSEKDEDYDSAHWHELSCQLSAAFHSSRLSEDLDDEPLSQRSVPCGASSEKTADSRVSSAGKSSSSPPAGSEQTLVALPASLREKPFGLHVSERSETPVPSSHCTLLASCASAECVFSRCASFLGTCAPLLSGSRESGRGSPVSSGPTSKTLERTRADEKKREHLKNQPDLSEDTLAGSTQNAAVRLCRANTFAPPPGVEARHENGEGKKGEGLPRRLGAGASAECGFEQADSEREISSPSMEDWQTRGPPCKQGCSLRPGEAPPMCNESSVHSSSGSHSFFSLSSTSSSSSCGSSSVKSMPSSASFDKNHGKKHAGRERQGRQDTCKERVERQKRDPPDPKGSRYKEQVNATTRVCKQAADSSTLELTTAEMALASIGKGVTTAIECGAATLVDFLADTLPRLSVEPDYKQMRVRTPNQMVRPRSCSPSLLRRERSRFASVSRALSSCGLPSLCNPSGAESPDEERTEKLDRTQARRGAKQEAMSSSVATTLRAEAVPGSANTKDAPVQFQGMRAELEKTRILPRSFASALPAHLAGPSLVSPFCGNSSGGWGLIEGRLRGAPALLENRRESLSSKLLTNAPLSFLTTVHSKNDSSALHFGHANSSSAHTRAVLEVNPQSNWLSSHSPQFALHKLPSHTPPSSPCIYITGTCKASGITPLFGTAVNTQRGTFSHMPAPVQVFPLPVRATEEQVPLQLPRDRHSTNPTRSKSSLVRSVSAGGASPFLSTDAPPLPVAGSCGTVTDRAFTPSTQSLGGPGSPFTEERTPDDFCCHSYSKLGALTPCTTATATTSGSTMRQPSSEQRPLKGFAFASFSPPVNRLSASGFVNDASTEIPLHPKLLVGEEDRASLTRSPSRSMALAADASKNSPPETPRSLPFSFSAPSGFCSTKPAPNGAEKLEKEQRAEKHIRSLRRTAPVECQRSKHQQEKVSRNRREDGRWKRLGGCGNEANDTSVHMEGETPITSFPSRCGSLNGGETVRETDPQTQREREREETPGRSPSANMKPSTASSCFVEEKPSRDRENDQAPRRKRLPAVSRARFLLEEIRHQEETGGLTKEAFPMEEVLDLMKHFDVLDVNGVSVYKLEADWKIPKFFTPHCAPSDKWVEKNHADGVNFMAFLQEITAIATDLYQEPSLPNCRLQSQGNLDESGLPPFLGLSER